jgi:DNA-binding response OmpR family regulator
MPRRFLRTRDPLQLGRRQPIRKCRMPRILVVDDQSDVRAMICIVLRTHQFEVVEAASAATALRAFEDLRFELAIVDVFLEETNGFDVIALMRRRVPDLPVVAMSGMSAAELVAASPGLANVICLSKPFRPNELMCAIDAARGSVQRPAVGVAAEALL